jgi:hypothetical protein
LPIAYCQLPIAYCLLPCLVSHKFYPGIKPWA